MQQHNLYILAEQSINCVSGKGSQVSIPSNSTTFSIVCLSVVLRRPERSGALQDRYPEGSNLRDTPEHNTQHLTHTPHRTDNPQHRTQHQETHNK